ncbi:MAG: Asp-tRNA(Asn)/Glu-tRNA(Gln) amidotransferase subunit GatB [Acidobacteriota bacterium]
MSEYETIIGLEVHAQLRTRTKVFCGCTTQFGNPPNRNTCPVCLGMPGILPVLNRRVVEFAMRTGLALNCTIQNRSVFARKNYFYPDLPKGYQISQYELPLATEGYLEVEIEKSERRIGITRVHLEEDAGKLVHEGFADSDRRSHVDFSRAGVPLIEIVSEPDLRSPDEAAAYLKLVRSILRTLEVCDGNMEEGSLRCDANVSIRPRGSDQFGTKTELKNLNSFRNVQRALAYEVERQTRILDEGSRVKQETRLWDAAEGRTGSMRSKEEAQDYRYFPDPDLLPLQISNEWIKAVRKDLPELPTARKHRFINDYGLPRGDAEVLTEDRLLADYFEEVVHISGNPKISANWILTELLREINAGDGNLEKMPVSAGHLGAMIKLIENKTISGKIAKTVFEEMVQTGKEPSAIVRDKSLVQIVDEEAILKIIDEVIAENPRPLAQYKDGKTATFGFFVGQVMKKTQGKANPQKVNELLRRRLGD